MRRIMTVVVLAALVAALTAGTALAETGFRYGTNAGDGLYGTPRVDRIDGLGGADLIYGYGSRDVLVGGDERGRGDKILGGGRGDDIRGEGGDDSLYGERGNDRIKGGAGNDTLVGGPGRDVLSSGPGPDSIDARDGEKDAIICGNEAETVYYDKGLDVLKGCKGTGGDARPATLSASSERAVLSTQPAPEKLFGHTGKVLVEHEGEELCVAEKELKGHLNHGDDILNPSGCPGSGQGSS